MTTTGMLQETQSGYLGLKGKPITTVVSKKQTEKEKMQERFAKHLDREIRKRRVRK
jgi:hypothetical protein